MAGVQVNGALKGMGTMLKGGSAGATTAIAYLTAIGGLDLSAATIDTTALDTTGGYKTYVGGLKDAGEVSMQGHFDPSKHTGLLTDFNAGTVNPYTIEFPDKGTTNGTQWTFNAIVTGYKTTPDMNGLVGFEAKLKVSGAPTLVPSA
jgi:predicted secreted protein